MRAACALQGLIPAVVYGAGKESVAVTVDPKVITKILYSESGHNTIFDLTIEGTRRGEGMIVDWQNEPIKGKLLHIDLKRIAMDKAMTVSVEVKLIGVPVGVKDGRRCSQPGAARGRESSACRRYSEPHRCRCVRTLR